MSLLREIASDNPTDAVIRVLPQTAPTAGTDFKITVPGQSVWEIVAITALLTPSAVVANRAPVLTVTDGSSTVTKIGPPAVVVAATATTFGWLEDGPTSGATTVGAIQNVKIPGFMLGPGWTIGPVTGAIDVGDTWTNVVLTVIEVFVGDVEHDRANAQRILDRLDAIAVLLGQRT
jgi:hypothetical protein